MALSLLALVAPDLTLAPLEAREPVPSSARLIDEAAPPSAAPDLSVPARAAVAVADDRRPAGGAVAPPAGPAVSVARFQAALDAARSRADARGVTFAAVRDGELLWTGSSGSARDGGRLPAESPLLIGSVTKTFVAATVLQLVDEGRASLDDRIGDHLPELARTTGRVTVRQLLDHTSGLADLFNDTTRRGLEDAPGLAWSPAEILATLRAPWYRPGEGWAYANTNYLLLGLLVERLTGRPLADELADRFLEPLGLASTRVLTGVDDGPLEPAWATIFYASGAMVSSAADVARWGDALYRGQVLSGPSRSAMLRLNGHDYGFGTQRIEVGRRQGVGHTGLLNTYTSLLLHLPDEDTTVALLVNRSHVDLVGMLRVAPEDGGPSLLELAIGP